LGKIKDHWYPDMPSKGQGYRSLTMDKRAHCDPVLLKAASCAGIDDPLCTYFKDFESILMWIDPDAVVVRMAYTFYLNIPPEEKVLYRSAIRPPNKSPPPSSPKRTHYRGPHSLRPPTPPQYLGNYRPNSTNGKISPPLSYGNSTFSSPQKNQYLGQPSSRNGLYYINHGNQSHYMWYNQMDNWNNNNENNNYSPLLSSAVFQNGNNYISNKQHPQPLYSELETQA